MCVSVWLCLCVCVLHGISCNSYCYLWCTSGQCFQKMVKRLSGSTLFISHWLQRLGNLLWKHLWKTRLIHNIFPSLWRIYYRLSHISSNRHKPIPKSHDKYEMRHFYFKPYIKWISERIPRASILIYLVLFLYLSINRFLVLFLFFWFFKRKFVRWQRTSWLTIT